MTLLARALRWFAFIVLCNGVGFASAMVANEPSFYEHLHRPSWAPSASVFGPVWTLLYTLMGTATWIVWEKTLPGSPQRRGAMAAFATQLALNAVWTPVFFGLHWIGVAIIVIVAVLVAVVVMGIRYARVQRWAGLAILPLAAWVGFASALNIAIWRLN
ncbi:tryptophan-rich sensory protein [soil metagenome]